MNALNAAKRIAEGKETNMLIGIAALGVASGLMGESAKMGDVYFKINDMNKVFKGVTAVVSSLTLGSMVGTGMRKWLK